MQKITGPLQLTIHGEMPHDDDEFTRNQNQTILIRLRHEGRASNAEFSVFREISNVVQIAGGAIQTFSSSSKPGRHSSDITTFDA